MLYITIKTSIDNVSINKSMLFSDYYLVPMHIFYPKAPSTPPRIFHFL